MFGRKFWLGATAFWLMLGIFTGIQVWMSMITHGHYVPLLLAYYVICWMIWLFFTWIIFVLTRRFPLVPATTKNILLHLLAGTVVSVIATTWEVALVFSMRPYDYMNPRWDRVNLATRYWFSLPLNLILYGGIAVAIHAIEYYSRYRQQEVEAAQLQTSLTRSRLHALELQLQPHFLFNTLNAVTSLVRTRKNDEAVTMVAGLSDILRYTLDHEGSQRVSVEAEIEVLRRYLEIQRSRFADRMSYSIDIDPAVRAAAVPTLILQPLAENAIRHGIACSAAGGSVSVRAFRENGSLRVDITNTGSLTAEGSHGIGLRNTRERLQQLYGESSGLSLHQTDDGVVASLRVPWSEIE
jgi:two-component system LytT family sensor kinase